MREPSSIEVTSILQSFQMAKDAILIHDDKISRLEQILNILQLQRDRLQDYARQQESLLAPIRKLPVEILTQIFSLCHLDSGYGLEIRQGVQKGETVKSPILALSHVCSHWRTVSISRPLLWSSISIDFERLEDDDAERLQSLIGLYLDRSRRAFLNIRMTSFYMYFPDERPELVFRALLAERVRWKTIVLSLGPSFLDDPIQIEDTSDSLHFPSLEAIELDWKDHSWPRTVHDSHPGDFLNSLLVNSPNLRRMAIPQFLDCQRFSSVMKFFDFRRLSSIEVNKRSYDWSIWRQINENLTEFSNLEKLSINLILPAHRIQENYRGTRCPNATSRSLKSLSMTLNYFAVSTPMLGALNLPSLTCLEISIYTIQDPGSHTDAWMQSLQGMLRCSHNTLVSFKLTCYNEFSANQLCTILSWPQRVQTLSLFADARALTSTLFSRLMFPSNNPVIAPNDEALESEQSPTLLPHLKTVTFGFTGLNFLIEQEPLVSKQASLILPDPDVIFNMILSRRHGNGVEDGLCHFGFSASTVLFKSELQNWAGIMRTKLRDLRPELQRGSSHWTCTLDLGEI
ncbi:hypothetical protein VKT23_008499 [Stygiomarasmius scandens]|uniref:F-box domain-containing protein n=1 Tax=Marasmiellus scandens TaxID=2682957 RepID=A0ABR1JL95_9AGAR